MSDRKHKSFKIPTAKTDLPLGMACGVVFSTFLFVLMAIAPLVGNIKPPQNDLQEVMVAFPPPEFEEIEEPEPEEPPEEEPPPEMEEPPPDLSLEQMDLVLNPGTGGSLAGDFALPTTAANAGDLGTEDFIDFSELDEPPKLIDQSAFNYPRSLRTKKVSGRVVVYIELDEEGNVTKAEVSKSDLPQFNDFVLKEISRRKFSAPTFQGRKVKAKANLPIPINIQ